MPTIANMTTVEVFEVSVWNLMLSKSVGEEVVYLNSTTLIYISRRTEDIQKGTQQFRCMVCS
jgi:hypothetical protein